MLGNDIWKLFDGPTVTGELEKNPKGSPGKIAQELFPKKHDVVPNKVDSELNEHKSAPAVVEDIPKELLDRAASTGNFGSRPSDLFLKMYIDVLGVLEADPLAGLVSPPLLPSCGVIPLSICSVIPDIIRHMADIIMEAKHEVLLSTNYWEASSAGKTITDAFHELDKRIGRRGGPPVVIKMMYDRGNVKQFVENRVIVPTETYTGDAVKLPAPEDIPNIRLEVMNYHRPLVGTFHAKYMVVDREIAILSSNNIQDRVNVEFMTHLEGPIVASMYDMGLLSWNKEFNPPLPLILNPPTLQTASSKYSFGNDHQMVKVKDLEKAKVESRKPLGEIQEVEHRDGAEQRLTDPATVPPHSPDPPSHGTPAAPQNDLQTTAVINKEDSETRFIKMADVTKHLNTNLQPDTVGDVQDDPNAPEFRPHIVHASHSPVPMVLVNRKPRGTPSHAGVDNPQGAAWLAGFKYAKQRVFIQTPTFNAVPAIEAALQAVRRGILVTLYLDIGFNDAGEMLPLQGGTNEQVISKMYAELEDTHKQNLKVHWYTGKDQSRPLNASQKKRNCHVKIMIVDGAVGIQGNGNQDSQSWFHSQEVNVMVDSPAIMKEWQEGLDANQNTLIHGQVEYDGIWRDHDGKPLTDTKGPQKGGIVGTLKGFKGAIDRVRGEGGF